MAKMYLGGNPISPTGFLAANLDGIPTAGSDKFVTSGVVYQAINIPVVNHGTSDAEEEITPNVFHIWGEMPSLTITLATPADASIWNEYHFVFTSGSTPTTLSLPSSILWANGYTPVIQANKTYEISISNGLGIVQTFS